MVVVQGAKPAQVVVLITGGNAVKAVQPLLEAAGMGVDILDMIAPLMRTSAPG